jgi:hypothetical protein
MSRALTALATIVVIGVAVLHFGMIMRTEKARRAWCAGHGYEAIYRKRWEVRYGKSYTGSNDLGCHDTRTGMFWAFTSMYSADMTSGSTP